MLHRIPGPIKKMGISALSSEAQAEAGINTVTLMTPQSTAQAITAQAKGFKNVVGRNGGLEVWQRGSSIAVAASTIAYTADGWYLATGANQASTVTRVTGTAAGSSFAAKVQRNSGQTGTTAMVFAFPLDTDELVKLQNRATVLSFSMTTGANFSPTSGTVSWSLYVGTGAVAKRNGVTYTSESAALSGSTAMGVSGSLRVVSPISATVGVITQAELQFTWTPTGTAGANDWFTLDNVQVEAVPVGISAVVPVFECTDYVWDLQRCARHLRKGPGFVTGVRWYGVFFESVAIATATFALSPAMRVTPTTVVVGTAANIQMNDLSVQAAFTTLASSFSTPDSFAQQLNGAGGWTAGRAGFIAVTTTADGFLLSAEI